MAVDAPTVVTYGGVQIFNCLTRAFTQESVYDDLSGTDLLHFKYTIRVVGYIHNLPVAQPQQTNSATFGFLPNTGGLNAAGKPSAADQLNHLHYLFNTRQTFQMSIGSYVVLFAQPANIPGQANISGFDCNNGPRAKVISVDSIASDTIMRVECEFEICQVQCDITGGTNNATGVINNRWSCVDDINSDWFTTRTFTGRLRCSSSMINPNTFRNLVVPPLQQGMRRDSMHFTVTEDGLNLDYTVIDKEIAFSAPAPATDWSLRVTSRRDLNTNISWYTDVDIMLKGDRYCDKKKLITIASAIADAKFGQGDPKKNNFLVEAISISDEYSASENVIHFSATARRFDALGVAEKGIDATPLGRPIAAADLAGVVNGYDSRVNRGSNPGENLQISGPIPVVGAFACFLQSPCEYTHSISIGTQTTTSQSPATVTLPTVSASVVTELSDDGSLGSVDPKNSAYAYTYWQLDSQYFTTQNRAHCPIAQTAGSSSSSGSNTSVVVNLAPPQTKRVIRVIAERIGVMPTLPAPADSYNDPSGAGAVLLENNLVATCPPRSCDNKQVFRIQGELTYGLLKAITNASQLSLGFNSWETNTPTYKMIFPEQAET
jgi:hypothetical protein